MKMKKLTQIVMATLLTTSTSAFAETLTLHGQEQVLSYYSNQLPATGLGQQNYENNLRKKMRVVLHNPNSFNVNVRLSTQRNFRNTTGNTTLDAPTPETITINANSSYIHEPYPSDTSLAFPDITQSYNHSARMCDLDMYTVITTALAIDPSSASLNCSAFDTIVKISWQDSLLRNSDSSIKSVSPIMGTVNYYHKFDELFVDESLQF